MEMHQIRYFLAVCETLNFTRAAENCHVAQPSLTRAIRKLEEELGGALLRRERSRTHLTDLGRLMKPHFERIRSASEAATAEAQDFLDLGTAPLKLGIMSTIGPNRLVGFLDRLRQEIPTIDLEIVEDQGQTLVDGMMQGDMDLALIGLPHFPDRLDARPLYDERYVIAFHQGHRFEGQNQVPIGDLDGENYLARAHCEFVDYFKLLRPDQKIDVNIRYSSVRDDWVQALILAQMGCAVMPEYLPLVPGIATRLLADPEVTRTISLVTVAGRRFSPAAGAFLNLIQRHDWKSAAA